MRLSNVKNIGGAILGLLLLLGIGVMSSTTAQAQYPYPSQDQYRRNRDYDRNQRDRYRRNRDYDYDRDQQDQYRRDRNRRDDWWNRNRRGRGGDGYDNYGGSYDARQTALNAGYNEGARVGRDDRRSGRRFDPERSSAFQNATKDYNSRMGDRWTYQRYFRDAFINGYSDAYNYGY